MNNQHLKNLLLINLAMLFVSTSGVLGRGIDMPPPLTIFWRAFGALLLTWLISRWQGFRLTDIKTADRRSIVLSGLLMGCHWVFYFYALQLSNVAIGMLSMFTYPVITAILEPIILKVPFQRIHLALGVLTLIGIYFLVPDLDLSNSYFLAVICGIISALSYALRNILMKNQVSKYNGLLIMYVQIMVVVIGLTPVFFFQGLKNISNHWHQIVLLALFTTVIGHTLFLMSFRNFSITTASIISCVQPIFGIILGAIFLGEYPHYTTYIGGIFIISAVLVESLRSIDTKKARK